MNEEFLGDRLRELRELRKMSGVDLFMISGVQQSDISRLENGKLPKPNYVTVKKLAMAFGVPTEYFYDEELIIGETLKDLPGDLRDLMKEQNLEYLYLVKYFKDSEVKPEAIKEIMEFHKKSARYFRIR